MTTPRRNFFWRSQRDGTSFLGLDLAVWIFKHLGRRAAVIPLGLTAGAVYLFSSRVRRCSRDYLARIEAEAKSRGIDLPGVSVYRHIYRFAEAVLERVLSWRGLIGYESLISEDDAVKRMLEELASPKGAVVMGAHIGSIEMLRGVLKVSGDESRRVNILIETSGNQRFLAYLKRINAQSATNFIPVDEITPATAMDLADKVAQGEWVVILGDRLSSPNARSVQIPFLGGIANLPQGPWILAQLLHVPVFSLFAVKERGQLRVYFSRMNKLKVKRGERERAVSASAAEFAEVMTQRLLKAPLDWFNFYDFWADAKANAKITEQTQSRPCVESVSKHRSEQKIKTDSDTKTESRLTQNPSDNAPCPDKE